MLIHLKLKNIALIEIIEINFQKGLNIITGDSGSGKSLILDSLNVLFGGNNIPLNHLIRPGEENCLIQAKFTSSFKVKDWLSKNGFKDFSSELTLTRNSYKKNNKILTRYTINDLLINKKKLEDLGTLLIDFAGQSDTSLYSSQESRKQIIDDLGSKNLENINLSVKKTWNELVFLKKKEAHEINLFKKQKENNSAVKEMLKILEDANLDSSDEITQLKIKESKLANDFEIKNCIQSTLRHFISYQSEDFTVGSLLDQSIRQLNRIADFDLEIEQFKDILMTIQNDLENFTMNLSRYLEKLENNNIDLEDVQSRLFFLQNLERTFSLELPGLIQKRDEFKKNIDSISNEEKIKILKTQIHSLNLILDNLYHEQTFERKKIANLLQQSVMSVLKKLGLANAKFFIEFKKVHPSSSGIDNINFLFSANPDQDLAPLSKIISGGEMSRFLLAIKSSISNNSSSFFLDEIDSGLSGKSLLSLVKLIKQISEERQVLCITHQPLLAAAANAHFKVQKKVRDGSTFTSITRLNTKLERQNELTEMIGGGFDEANDYASTLINKAAA